MDIRVQNSNQYKNAIKLDNYTEKTTGKSKHYDLEDIFKNLDSEINKVKEEDKEYYEKLEKYKKEQEKLKKEQKQKLAAKQALMEKTGMLFTAGLTDEAKQVLMQKSPALMAKYEQTQALKEKFNEKEWSKLV